MLIVSCTPSKTIVYQVNSYRADCVGVGPKKCLLIQKNTTIVDTAWQTFYAPIQGFEYEPGYLYKISVKEEKLDPASVPSDASSIRYTLVKVLEKKSDPKLRINDIWVLTSLNGNTIPPVTKGERRKNIQIQFQLAERRVMGTDGCNRFSGSIVSIGEKDIHLGNLASTRMMCPDMTFSNNFNQEINKVHSYSIANLQLKLYDKNGTELMIFKKID